MDCHNASNQQTRSHQVVVSPLSIVRVYHTHELIKFIVQSTLSSFAYSLH